MMGSFLTMLMRRFLEFVVWDSRELIRTLPLRSQMSRRTCISNLLDNRQMISHPVLISCLSVSEELDPFRVDLHAPGSRSMIWNRDTYYDCLLQSGHTNAFLLMLYALCPMLYQVAITFSHKCLVFRLSLSDQSGHPSVFRDSPLTSCRAGSCC